MGADGLPQADSGLQNALSFPLVGGKERARVILSCSLHGKEQTFPASAQQGSSFARKEILRGVSIPSN